MGFLVGNATTFSVVEPLKFLIAVDLGEVLEFSLGSHLKQASLKDSPQTPRQSRSGETGV